MLRGDVSDRLVANAWKLERLLTDLLDVDRLGRGVMEPKLQSVDLGALARRVAREGSQGEEVFFQG